MRRWFFPFIIMLGFSSNALAMTEAVLQVSAPGRADRDRHRLILTETMSGGRDVMLIFSCAVDDASRYGAVIDFGAGAVWGIEGGTVSFETDGGKADYQMDSKEEFLILAGDVAIEAFRPVLISKVVTFSAPNGMAAKFDLSAVAAHVKRFRELCNNG